MTKLVFLLLASLLMLTQAEMRAAELPATATGEEEILAIEHEACTAYLHGDADYLDRLFTDDFHITNGRAEVNTKAAELAEVRAKQIYYTVFENRDQTVLLHGDAAAVVGITTVKGSVGADQAFAVEVRFTDMFVRIAGKWRMLAGHSHKIVPMTYRVTVYPEKLV